MTILIATLLAVIAIAGTWHIWKENGHLAEVALCSSEGIVLSSAGLQRPHATTTQESMFDHEVYLTLEALSTHHATDMIACGVVLDQGAAHASADGHFANTHYTIKVQSVLKGDKTLGGITLAMPGGIVDETEYRVRDVPDLEPGEVVFFFATQTGNVYAPLTGGTTIAKQTRDGNYKLGTNTLTNGPATFTEHELARLLR